MKLEFNKISSPKEAKKQFNRFIKKLQKVAIEAMKTPERREWLRREICAMQGIPFVPLNSSKTFDSATAAGAKIPKKILRKFGR